MELSPSVSNAGCSMANSTRKVISMPLNKDRTKARATGSLGAKRCTSRAPGMGIIEMTKSIKNVATAWNVVPRSNNEPDAGGCDSER
jgi:hypothetical protein